MTIERQVKSGSTDITWYVPARRPNVLCRLRLHRLTFQLRADGYVSYFTHVRRFRCLCGRYEWIEYNGSIVERDDASTPEEDAAMAAFNAKTDAILADLRQRVEQAPKVQS